MPLDWIGWETITGTLVNVTVIVGALVAVVKLRLYNLLAHRFKSEVVCSHVNLADGRVLFCGDYIVHNTGDRQIWLKCVHLRLVCAKTTSDSLISPNEEAVLAERQLVRGGKPYKGLHRLEAGERSIFSLRCILDDLDDFTFFVCKFEWPYRRTPSPYISLYVKSQCQDDTHRKTANGVTS